MKKQRLKRTLITGVISISIALSSIGAFAINKSPTARLLIRDAVVATVAHHKSGKEILLDSDYGDFMTHYSVSSTQNVYSNSLWALNYSEIIVPFFKQEGIREIPTYPHGISVEPLNEEDFISLAGLAYFEDKVIVIFVDEQNDARQLLPILIHEHVHLQGGRFISDIVPPWLSVVVSESNTQAATMEVLAAMCHSGDTLACDAFWDEVKDYSSCAFWTRLQYLGLEKYYSLISALFWPNGIDFQTASTRLIYIYLQCPWDELIMPGVLGEALDTGNLHSYEVSDGNFVCQKLFMSFDDTEDLLGWLDRFIEWITPD